MTTQKASASKQGVFEALRVTKREIKEDTKYGQKSSVGHKKSRVSESVYGCGFVCRCVGSSKKKSGARCRALRLGATGTK